MSTIVEPLPHDLAVVAALRTIGKPVEFARAPANALENLRSDGPDYMTVWPISSGRDGSLADPWSDGSFSYQFDIVARLPEGARYLIARIDQALASLVIPGRAVTQIIPVSDGRVLGDFDVTPHIYTAQPERRIETVPA